MMKKKKNLTKEKGKAAHMRDARGATSEQQRAREFRRRIAVAGWSEETAVRGINKAPHKR